VTGGDEEEIESDALLLCAGSDRAGGATSDVPLLSLPLAPLDEDEVEDKPACCVVESAVICEAVRERREEATEQVCEQV